jgi:GxxExxY protein
MQINANNANNFYMKLQKIIYPELSYKIYGLLFKTHNQVGRYGTERQYGDVMETFLKENQIKYEREKILPPLFEGEREGRHKVDFIIENKIILEFKVKPLLTKQDYFQIKRYLEVANLKVGILVNFHQKILKPQRIINSKAKE